MRIHTLLDLQSLILYLQKEILFSKYIAQAVCILASAIVFLLDHRFRHRTLQTRRQRNQSATVFGEQIVVNARLVVETFQESRGDQFDQIVVALEVFAKQHQVIVAALTGSQSSRSFAALGADFSPRSCLLPLATYTSQPIIGFTSRLLASLKKFAAANRLP